jgi:signal transduction histidine kinase
VSKGKELDRAKTEFISLASHQLRTPLSIISTYIEILNSSDPEDKIETIKDKLEELKLANEKMVQLINGLLDISSLDIGAWRVEARPVDIKVLAQTVIDMLALEIESKKIDFKADFGKNLKPVSVDPKLFHIILENLLTNAVKYTPEKGKVSLALDRADEQLKITVSDTGYGISKADQPRVFTKLFRTKIARKISKEGVGLGLYIVKSVVDMCGGTISLKSEEGKGTTFVVTIPTGGGPNFFK